MLQFIFKIVWQCFICTDVALFWFHHSTGLCYMFLT